METAKGSVEVDELTKLQQTTARRVAESKATIPHVYLEAEVDAAAALRTASDAGAGIAAAVVRAAALALREHPRLNGAYRDGRLERYSRANVGIVVAAQDTVLVPTIFDADAKGLAEIAAESRRLAEAARAGGLAAPDLAGGTFTVLDVAEFALGSIQPVINGGQAAVLALSGLAQAPVARDGEVVVTDVLRLTLACDHRIIGGAEGAAFLGRVRAFLEEPEAL